jgi:RNA polymerase sigma-70 factor (ECF subfamily)
MILRFTRMSSYGLIALTVTLLSGLDRHNVATFRQGPHPMYRTMSNEISLEKLISGDRAEFARLVDMYSSSIYRLGLKMLGNPQDAEDVLQNTFLNALMHLSTFEARASVATWLYRIAANEALMLIRKKKPEVSLEGDSEDGEMGSPQDLKPTVFADWSDHPEDELLSSEEKGILDAAIQTLPEALRIVFVLRDIEGLSIKETADTLSLTETNVKTRLLRARMSLRERLSKYYAERLQEEEK